jgi:hypothetical protein
VVEGEADWAEEDSVAEVGAEAMRPQHQQHSRRASKRRSAAPLAYFGLGWAGTKEKKQLLFRMSLIFSQHVQCRPTRTTSAQAPRALLGVGEI